MSDKMNRRKFLKLAGTAAVAVSAAGLLAGCEDVPGADPDYKPGSAGADSGSAGSGSSGTGGADSGAGTGGTSQGESTLKIIWSTRDNGDGTATLVGYEKTGAEPVGKITLPTEWMGRKIIGVENNLGGRITDLTVPGSYEWVAGLGSDNLQKVTINQGVQTLRKGAFEYSGKLTSVTLPNTIKTIEYHAFYRCGNLSRINIPTSLKILGEGVLEGCTKLTSITLPEGLEEMHWGACRNSGLTSITIPSTIKKFDAQVFSICADLTSATVNSTILGEGAFDGCEKLKSVTLSDKILQIPGIVFRNCKALASVHLPANLKEIGSYAFENCTALTSFVFPANAVVMNEGSFRGAGLRSVRLPYGMTEISYRGFVDCPSLTDIHIPVTVNLIGDYAFGNTPATKLYYAGTQAQWKDVTFGRDNGSLGANGIYYGQY